MTIGVIFVENYIAGGGDQVARALIQALPFSRLTVMVNRGDDTRILLSGELPDHVDIDRYGLVTIAELSLFANAIQNPILRFFVRALFYLLRYPLFVFSILYFIIRIRRSGATVFLSNNGGYPGAFYCRSASIAASLLPGVKAFHAVHGGASRMPSSAACFEWCIDRAIDLGCRLIAVSHATARRLADVRCIRQSVAVIYNGIPDILAPPQSKTIDSVVRILHVGYFDQNKNQALLIKAIAELAGLGVHDVSVRFVGADSGTGHLDQCQHLAITLGVAKHVVFSGFTENMISCYEDADIFVLCSTSEGLPVSILEAMRAGKPIVATNVGGMAEQVTDGVNGFLIEAGDYSGLAAAIGRLLKDREMRVRFGKASRELYKQKFSISQMTAAYVKVLGL